MRRKTSARSFFLPIHSTFNRHKFASLKAFDCKRAGSEGGRRWPTTLKCLASRSRSSRSGREDRGSTRRRRSTVADGYGGGSGGGGPDGDEGLRVCAVPPVPERQTRLERLARARKPHTRHREEVGERHQAPLLLLQTGPWQGPQTQIDYVTKAFEIWADLGIGIEFVRSTTSPTAEIRIGFLQGDGAWSYVGRDVLGIRARTSGR